MLLQDAGHPGEPGLNGDPPSAAVITLQGGNLTSVLAQVKRSFLISPHPVSYAISSRLLSLTIRCKED
jgi:hypothetical protein